MCDGSGPAPASPGADPHASMQFAWHTGRERTVAHHVQAQADVGEAGKEELADGQAEGLAVCKAADRQAQQPAGSRGETRRPSGLCGREAAAATSGRRQRRRPQGPNGGAALTASSRPPAAGPLPAARAAPRPLGGPLAVSRCSPGSALKGTAAAARHRSLVPPGQARDRPAAARAVFRGGGSASRLPPSAEEARAVRM